MDAKGVAVRWKWYSFIYGLGFFILGFAVTLYPKKNSTFALAEHLYLIAGFGFLHGINE